MDLDDPAKIKDRFLGSLLKELTDELKDSYGESTAGTTKEDEIRLLIEDIKTQMKIETEKIAEQEKRKQEHEQFGIYIKRGWTRVEVTYWTNKHPNAYYGRDRENQIVEWAIDNCVGKYHRNGQVWYFESPADATAFALTWVR